MVRISGPQIRGGEAAALLRFATFATDSLDDRFDVLIALDWQNVHRFASEIPLGPESLIIVDPSQGTAPEAFKGAARYVELPMKNLSKSVPGSWPNMIALGIAAALLGLPHAALEAGGEEIDQEGRRGLAASLAAMVCRACRGSGHRRILHAGAPPRPRAGSLPATRPPGLGAIRGGVRFVAAYPITPATEMLEWMAPALAQVGGVLVQAEDELASINMAIGASFGGVPALTATAGPGLSLMTEALGLAVAAEVPVVVVDVMRGGPSTGIPAKAEQSDISIAVNGLHGDAPRIVLAPNSIADCIVTTQWAVHLAESLQVPVMVLSDQFIGQSRAVINAAAAADLRGRAPDCGGGHGELPALCRQRIRRLADGDTRHRGCRLYRGRPGAQRVRCALERSGGPSCAARQTRPQAHRTDYGPHWADVEGDGEIAVITLGSSTGPVREALAAARERGVSARMVSIRLLAPARPAELATALAARGASSSSSRTAAQLHRYLRSQYDLPGDVRSLAAAGPAADTSFGGRPGNRRMGPRMNRAVSAVGEAPAAKAFKSSYKPIWCPGCGDFSVLSSLTKALAMLGKRPENVAVVSGIGCSSRIPAYTTCYGFHGVHGRALPTARGIEGRAPRSHRGGDRRRWRRLFDRRQSFPARVPPQRRSHLHRDGQSRLRHDQGPALPDHRAGLGCKLSPGGTGLRTFHPLVIALAAGANFVARAFSGDPNGTAAIIAQAISTPGFSFVEVLSPCVTYRPEQREWKNAVRPAPVAQTDDPARAARRIMTDDGFNIGMLFTGTRKPYQPPAVRTPHKALRSREGI